MNMRWLSIAAFFIAAAVIFDYGCGGSSSVNNTTSPPPVVSPTPTSASMTIPLAANTALPMPAFGGFSGTFTEVSNVPAGTTVQLTTQLTPPAGAPVPLDGVHHRLSTVSAALAATASVGTPIVWVSQVYSAGVTFNAFPVTTWLLPPSLVRSGPFELEEFDATTGTLVDIELAKGADSNGNVGFGGSSAPFTTVAGHKYWWELVAGFTQVSATPTPCGASTASTTLNPAGQAVSLPAACGVTATLNISPNNAPASDGAVVTLDVPALLDPLGPPAKPGTTTGVITLSTKIDITATFNNGMYQFAIVLPSSIPTTGKSFFLSACTIETKRTLSGFSHLGCTSSPFITGPLLVSSQTVSFPGIPFPLVLSGPVDCGPNHKHCFFDYEASLFY